MYSKHVNPTEPNKQEYNNLALTPAYSPLTPSVLAKIINALHIGVFAGIYPVANLVLMTSNGVVMMVAQALAKQPEIANYMNQVRFTHYRSLFNSTLTCNPFMNEF